MRRVIEVSEKSEKPVIYECPSCGSDETPQRHHFGGPKDGRNKECSCSSCSYQGFIEEFRIERHYCVLCGDKYRDAEDLGLHLVLDHDANEYAAADAENSPAKTESNAEIAGENLEPVGHVEAETVENELTRGVVKYGACDGLEELPEGTPLFTADQIIELVDAAWQDVNRDLRENDAYGDETFKKQAIIGSDLATAEIKHRLEEFTQNGDAE